MSQALPTTLPPPSATEDTTPGRRTFSPEYKLKILTECDAVTEPGGIGAILRREGLYSSQLVDWRRRRAEDGIHGLGPKKKGRPAKDRKTRALEQDVGRLEREVARLQDRLRRSEIIIDAQKKLSELLALLPPMPAPTEKPE
jgi:transposase